MVETMGFVDKTTLVVFTNLWATYGEIDDDMMADNLERIKTPWSPQLISKSYFTKSRLIWISCPRGATTSLKPAPFGPASPSSKTMACCISTVNSGDRRKLESAF